MLIAEGCAAAFAMSLTDPAVTDPVVELGNLRLNSPRSPPVAEINHVG